MVRLGLDQAAEIAEGGEQEIGALLSLVVHNGSRESDGAIALQFDPDLSRTIKPQLAECRARGVHAVFWTNDPDTLRTTRSTDGLTPADYWPLLIPAGGPRS